MRQLDRERLNVFGADRVALVGIAMRFDPRFLPVVIESVDGDPGTLVVMERIGREMDRFRVFSRPFAAKAEIRRSTSIRA